MADLANLRISVDSREVKTATSDLNNLSRASGDAERSASKLSSAAKLFGGALAAAGIFGLAANVAKASAEFQSLNASLKVATGSAAAATAAFNEIKKFAVETPYQLNQVVEGFLKLKNLGLDPSMASLRSYGNTAASMGKSLNQMIEAVADASTMEFERLKEFGIKAKQQKDTVTFTFQGVATTVKKNSEEIQQYLINIGNTQFAGAMDEQMKTLNGQFSNLKDSIDNFYVTLGNAGAANFFSQALNAASNAVVYLTDNLDKILRAIEVTMVAVAGMAAAFLAFRAALGVQAIIAYITQMVALNIALGATSTASALAGVGIKALQAALASTGFGLAIVAIGALVGAIYSLATAQSRAREETNGHIAALKQLAQTRSADWAQKRTDMELEARLLDRDIKRIKERQSAQGARGQAEGAAYVASDLAAKQEQLDTLRFGLKQADVLKEQADAAAKVAAPTAAAAAGIAKTGKAAKEAIDPLEKYRDALAGMVEEGKKIGMTPEAIKKFEVEKLATEAAAAGHEKYKKATQQGAGNELADRIRKQGMFNAFLQYEADIREQVSDKLKDYAKSIVEANKAHSDTMTKLRGEATLIGLVGVEREKASLALEREAYVLKHGETAWKEYYAARLAGIDKQSVFDKDIEALQTLTNNLETAAGMIGGKGGRALQGALKMELVLADGTTEKLSQTLAKSFKGLSDILAQAVAGMQIGNLVGGAAGSKTGGTIGGGIGGALGKKLLTGGLEKIMPQLGQFAGPLGALAGGLLGGVIGGLLKKTKTGSVTLNQIAGGAMERTLTGNSAQLKDIANNMANGLLKGLGSMAEQLGGTLGGNVKVSLGMRKKDFVVDPTGAGRTKGAGVKNFGTDEAAAIAYVTQLAIQQGIVTGISAGAQTLIRAGNDLNEQVQKALKFDQVFKDLVNESDPLRASLDELSVEMEKLKVIFKEAGASAADYAKLEELYAIKQAKAIFEANRPRRELEIQLMEAQGRSVEALAASRQLELEAMDASLRSLQTMIYAEQDLGAARAAEQSAISDLRAAVDMLNSNVAEAEANLAEALRAQRERQMESYRAQIADLDVIIAKRQEAQDALRRAYDAEIARIDDEISKRNSNIKSLEDAYSSEASIMQGTIDQFRDFASSLRDFAASIIPMNGTGPQSLEGLRRRFADVTKAALGGDKTAMGEVVGVGGQLRESIMANASDRTSMLRQLYALQAQTNTVVSGAEDQATIAERQLAEAKLQSDHLVGIENKAIAQLEAQKAATTALVGQFIQLTEATLSVDEAIRQLQTAEQAAVSAEQQKAYLQAQIDALAAVDASVMSVEQAQRELDEAKAERDSVLAEINARGFGELIAVTKQTGAEMARIAMSAIDSARASAAQAQAALDAARAAAVKPPVVPVVTPPVVSVLPDNVIPFPIMGGGSGAAGGFNDIGIPQNLYGGGSGGGSFREFGLNNNIRPFANGGIHSGGIRIVGENGPEIEATGPSRIYNSNQLGNMLNHGATADEVKALREEMKVAMYQIAKNTGKNYDLMNRWDGDGLPPERIVG